MKWHFRGNKEMNWLAFWNCLLGVVSIPINLMIASSLANAVSAMADGNYQGCFHYVMVFGAFTILRLTILVIKKSSIARLTGTASQAFRQSLYKKHLRPGVRIEALASVLPECCLLFGNIAFLLLGMHLVATGKIGTGNLVAFFTYLTLTTSLVTQIYSQWRQLAQLPDSVDRIISLLSDAECGGTLDAKDWSQIHASHLVYSYVEDGPSL